MTGASSGIGRALAERAVRAGWDVLAVGRRTERLDALAAVLGTAMGRIETLALDLREPMAARRIVRETLDQFGRIDVLVNCAGGTAVGRITDQNDEALYEQLETHVIVPLALAREAMPSLRETRGLVIFFGSGVARIPVGTLGAYPPAKAAVRNMARVARNELARDGVAVSYVDPGAVATEFMTRVGFAGPPAAIAASPYDVARAVFAAFTTRKPVVNAVPWQTLFVALGEAFPRLTDLLLARAPGLVGGDRILSAAPVATALPVTAAAQTVEPFEESVARGAMPPEDVASSPAESLFAAVPGIAAPDAPPPTAPAAILDSATDVTERSDGAPAGSDYDASVADGEPHDVAAEVGIPSERNESETAPATAAQPMLEPSGATETPVFATQHAPQHDASQHDASQHDAPQHDALQHDALQHDAPQHDDAREDAATQLVDDSSLAARDFAGEPVAPDVGSLPPAPPANVAANAAVDSALCEAAARGADLDPTTFEGALAPHSARMKKLNMRAKFVRELLVPGNELDLGYVAMRWAGMPNKNERGLTADVLGALAGGGFLEPISAEKFRVVRAAEAEPF
ncbi:MAG: hypothetical protein NVSMB59_20780 [Vulcanimicrobiaceae bacterium]